MFMDVYISSVFCNLYLRDRNETHFMTIATLNETLGFLFVVFRSPTLHTNIPGVAKDPLTRFRGVDLKEDDWRQS